GTACARGEELKEHLVDKAADLCSADLTRGFLALAELENISVVELERAFQVRVERGCAVFAQSKPSHHVRGLAHGLRSPVGKIDAVLDRAHQALLIQRPLGFLAFPEKALHESGSFLPAALHGEQVKLP